MGEFHLKYTKYIGIIGFMVLITLSSGCISLGGFADVFYIGDDSSNITEVNKTSDGTYSAYGVSFKCPGDWSVGILEEKEKNSIAACKIQNSSIQPQFIRYNTQEYVRTRNS